MYGVLLNLDIQNRVLFLTLAKIVQQAVENMNFILSQSGKADMLRIIQSQQIIRADVEELG